jgi:hypothetical protein
MRIIQQGVQASTPFSRPSEWSQPEWTPECTAAIKETRRAFRRCTRRDATDEDWNEYKELRNKKGKLINKTLRNGFRSWVRQAIEDGPRGLWKVSKWARTRDQPSCRNVPALSIAGGPSAETNQQKAEVLRRAFFPHPPEADLSDIPSTRLPKQLDFPAITDQEVRDAIRRAPPDKAAGEDTIPNRV